MKRCLGACLLSTLFACQLNPARQCTKDSDCLGTDVCDVAVHSCVTNPSPDGGPGLGWTLTLTAPVDGARVNASAVATAQLTFFGGPTPTLPASVTLSATPATGNASTLAKSGTNTYVGSLPSGLVTDQVYTLQAAFPNGLADGGTVVSNTVSVTFDNIAPVFTVTVVAPSRGSNDSTRTVIDPDGSFDGGQAYRRDEIATVQITSSATDVDAGSVRLTVTGVGTGVTPIPVTLTPCTGTSFCAQGLVDMSQPLLQAFNGYFALNASGADTAGNNSGGSAFAGVTRWKWSYDAGTPNIKASPAIGHLGTIYFGTTAGSAGSIFALTPDGTKIWEDAVGSVLASPAVGTWDGGSEPLYVGSTKSSGALALALDCSDGGAFGSYSTSTSGDGIESAVSVSPTTSIAALTVESSLFVVNSGGTGDFVAFRPTDAAHNTITFSIADQVLFPAPTVTDGTSFFFGDNSGVVYGLVLSAANWTAKPNWPVNVAPIVPSGMALDSTSGNVFAGGGGGAGVGSILNISVPVGNTAAPASYSTNPNHTFSLALSSNEVFFTDAHPYILKTALDLPATTDGQATTDGPSAGSPLLGVDGTVYTATTGSVEAWNSTLGAPHSWSLAGHGPFESSPTIDCSRNADGSKQTGRPGVLYAGSDNGSLYAIIVDSRGIDTTAIWPKYQHDPRNTGNSSTSLTEFQCP